MKESLVTKLPTNELMNPSQKKKRKHRQVLDKLVLFSERSQIPCFVCQRIPGNPHLAPICARILPSRRAADAAGWTLAVGRAPPPAALAEGFAPRGGQDGAWLAAGGQQPWPQLPAASPAACVLIAAWPALAWLCVRLE